MRLPEADPEIFRIYVQWAYSNRILTPSDEDRDRLRMTLTELYLLGQYLGDPRLQNRIVNLMIQNFARDKKDPATENLAKIWTSTPESDKLRQLMLDWHVDVAAHEWLQQYHDNIPPAFFADLAINLAAKKPKKGWEVPSKAEKCKYHHHDDKTPPCT